MKSGHDPLERLLRSAAAVPAPAVKPLPFAVEARVLAAWRQGGGDSELLAIARLLRRGFALATGVALVVATTSLFVTSQSPQNLAVEEFALSADAITFALAQ